MENQETDNVLHFVEETATADVELHLILALVECFTTHLLPVTSSAWSLRDVIWKKVSPTLGPEMVTVPTGDLTADGNAAALPSFNSVVISKRTLEGGRSKRGRMFLPGIPEAATVNSQLDTTHAFWTAVLAFAACLATKFINIGEPLGSDQFALAVYSRTIGGSTLPYGASGFTKVSSLTVSQLIGSTRSRKVGRGA
jgi:hypothetical protein